MVNHGRRVAAGDMAQHTEGNHLSKLGGPLNKGSGLL